MVSEQFITPACTVCILLLSAPWAFLSLQIACIGACAGCSIVHEWCDSISLSWMSRSPPLAYCCWGFAFVETARLMRKYCCIIALVERLLELCFSSWCVGILLWSVWAPSSYCMFSFEVREHSPTHGPYSGHSIVCGNSPPMKWVKDFPISYVETSIELSGYPPVHENCVDTYLLFVWRPSHRSQPWSLHKCGWLKVLETWDRDCLLLIDFTYRDSHCIAQLRIGNSHED